MSSHPYKTLSPSHRIAYPTVWRGFDLSDLNTGDEFAGCIPCGVQFVPIQDTAYKAQCPNCGYTCRYYVVTQQDVDAKTENVFNCDLDSFFTFSLEVLSAED